MRDDDRALLDRMHLLSGVQFERLCGELFEAMGYAVKHTPTSGDRGIDLELVKDGRIVLVQCKRQQSAVGEPAVRDFFGVVTKRGARKGIFCTNGSFSTRAENWAEGMRLELMDGAELASLWREHASHIPLPEPEGSPLGASVQSSASGLPARESLPRVSGVDGGSKNAGRLERAIAKWERAGCESLGIPRPTSPYPVDGIADKRLYAGPDGKGEWVLVRDGQVVFQSASKRSVMDRYDRAKLD